LFLPEPVYPVPVNPKPGSLERAAKINMVFLESRGTENISLAGNTRLRS